MDSILESMHVHTGHTAGSPSTAMHSSEQRLSAMQRILLPDYLAAGLRHIIASAPDVTQKSQHAEHMTGSIHT